MKQSLEKRTRYYHSQMEMELLQTGTSYEELPDCYVLSICDFDPFQLGKYRYTVRHVLVENEKFTYQDGSHMVFLSTKGTNDGEVPWELVRILKFVAAGLKESTADYGDTFVAKLQASIKKIKSSREMGERYMLFEEMLRDERAAGKAEAVIDILDAYGEVPEELTDCIMSEKDNETLKRLLRCIPLKKEPVKCKNLCALSAPSSLDMVMIICNFFVISGENFLRIYK